MKCGNEIFSFINEYMKMFVNDLKYLYFQICSGRTANVYVSIIHNFNHKLIVPISKIRNFIYIFMIPSKTSQTKLRSKLNEMKFTS